MIQVPPHHHAHRAHVWDQAHRNESSLRSISLIVLLTGVKVDCCCCEFCCCIAGLCAVVKCLLACFPQELVPCCSLELHVMPQYRTSSRMWFQRLRIRTKCTGPNVTTGIGFLSTGCMCQVCLGFEFRIAIEHACICTIALLVIDTMCLLLSQHVCLWCTYDTNKMSLMP